MIDNKPKICFLVFSLEAGGLQMKLLRLIKFLGKNVDIVIIIKGKGIGGLEDSFIQCGVKILYIKTGYLDIKGWFKVFKIFRSEKFQTVCDFTSNFAGIYMGLGKMAKIPNRIAYYGQSSNHFVENYFNLIYNKIINLFVRYFSTIIVSNSSGAFEFFFGANWINNNRYIIIDNGLYIDNFISDETIREELQIPKTGFVIGHAGRFDRNKNHSTIMKVAQHLVSSYDDFFFIFCGKGTGRLKSEIDSLGLGKKIYALDFREDMNVIFNSINLFYFPSFSEGQSNALAEAMIAGIPIICSKIKSNYETVPECIQKFMVDAEDVEGAINGILSIKKNPNIYPVSVVKEWAKNKYDANIKFQEFYKILFKY